MPIASQFMPYRHRDGARVIARLERRLGARLFERLPHGVRLTAPGATLAGRARLILREIEAAEEALGAARAGRAGPSRVTAVAPWNEALLARATARTYSDFLSPPLENPSGCGGNRSQLTR